MAQNDTLLEVPGIEGVTRPELDEKVIEQEYGLTVESTYKFAIAQYREQERNRTILIDYHHRLRFIALSKQAKYGTFKEDGIECGWFDLVGNDAKKTWKAIASISQQEAMLEFIRLLDAVCPTFRTQIEHQRKIEHHNQQQRKSSNGGTTNSENENQCINNYLNQRQKLLQVDHSPIESEEILQQFEQQRRQIQEALNKQTYHQFLAYAQQTHPGETEKQENLIRQLQEQHYQQYMSQVYAQAQAASQAAVAANVNANQPQNSANNNDPEAGIGATTKSSGMMSGNNGPQPLNGKVKSVDELAEEAAEAADSDVSDEDDPSETPANPKVAPASMWTTKNLAEFKETIKKDGPEGILKIGHGETVTVRVPTHPEGNSLFWEFCTDHYDLGFGVYFEWTVAETNQVTVHVDESGDEYDEEEAESGGGTTATSTTGSGDVEAEAVKKQQDPNKPRIDEIIPTFRRDCHEEVFFGSHVYPGRGVYLLKFDNSYSLWRSKTLYYRVFYSK